MDEKADDSKSKWGNLKVNLKEKYQETKKKIATFIDEQSSKEAEEKKGASKKAWADPSEVASRYGISPLTCPFCQSPIPKELEANAYSAEGIVCEMCGMHIKLP